MLLSVSLLSQIKKKNSQEKNYKYSKSVKNIYKNYIMILNKNNITIKILKKGDNCGKYSSWFYLNVKQKKNYSKKLKFKK